MGIKRFPYLPVLTGYMFLRKHEILMNKGLELAGAISGITFLREQQYVNLTY